MNTNKAMVSTGQMARFIASLSDWVAEEARDHLEWAGEHDAPQLESPIELAFWLAWTTQGYVFRLAGPGNTQIEPVAQFNTQACGENYRLDFAFVDEIYGIKVAVELDGHDFHERTPEQVERRNRRDGNLQSAGWYVLHFSGRQVLSNPRQCVDDVYTALCDCQRPRR